MLRSSLHTTILFLFFFISSTLRQTSMKTRGSCLREEFPGYKDTNVICMPFPKDKTPSNSRSIVPAPVVSTHGAPLIKVPYKGPSFPAEATTSTPFSMAAKVAIAIGSSPKKLSSKAKPKDRDNISTPSRIAWSIAARTSDEKTPYLQAALYIAILALGAMPLAVPLA
ncbi:hypothetical protein CIPAW_01G017100 [Carya illinoinensis]|uniref:Uncharacterized protein n=1 Tax=Carya illinoinensis TaxID=32201 RepID=A0A8T1RH07_CARIL|nr:hypothetical protein CIPAW_01G017100 [Carya illinoinensis]